MNPGGANGLFYGNPGQFILQIKATLFTIIYSFIVSYLLLKIVDVIFGLRISENNERIGLDLTEHRETAYTLID